MPVLHAMIESIFNGDFLRNPFTLGLTGVFLALGVFNVRLVLSGKPIKRGTVVGEWSLVGTTIFCWLVPHIDHAWAVPLALAIISALIVTFFRRIADAVSRGSSTDTSDEGGLS